MVTSLKHFPVVLYTYKYISSDKGRFVYVSDASKQILGLEPAEIMEDSASLECRIDPYDKVIFDSQSKAAWQAERDFYWKGRFNFGTNERILEIRSTHGIDDQGEFVRYGLIQDVSELVTPEEESQIRYQGLVDKLPIGVAIHRHGKLVYANAMAHSILGACPGELLGTHVMNYIHPAYRDGILDILKEATASVSPLLEQTFLTVDGREIIVETTAFPFTYLGAPSIQVIFRDITEKKTVEKLFRKNDTLFTNLFHNIPIAVVLLDEVGKVELINHGFEIVFGYQLNEVLGKNLNDFIVPDQLSHEGVDLNNLITSKKVVSVETQRKRRDGTLLNVILYGVPVSLNGQTISIYGVYVDITDRKKVEDELKVRNAELDNFVYKVSHDLRAPLSSVLGLVNLAKLPGNTDNPLDYIELIGTKVEQLDNFIGDVLSHSKNLKMDVTLGPVDLKAIAESTISDLSYLEGSSEVIFQIEYSGCELISDRWRIAEIFRNLVSNAIKYRRQDGTQAYAKIGLKVDQQRAEIVFSDNGIGVDPSSLDRIFDMFYRATEQSDGSGIGLYIVKNAIDKLGGQISVSSEPLKGTTFVIILPNQLNLVPAGDKKIELKS